MALESVAQENRAGIVHKPPGDVSTARQDPRRWWVLAACCVVAFAQTSQPGIWMMGLDIPDTAFGAAWNQYRIYANTGLIVFLAFLIGGGLIGDLVGRRRVFLVGAVGFTLANVLSLLARDPVTYLVMRALVGMFGGIVFPLTLAYIRLSFGGDERSLAMVIYTVITSVATLAALLAVVIQPIFGWRATLALPIITGAAGAYLAWRDIPHTQAHGGMRRAEAFAAAAWTLIFLALLFGMVVARAQQRWDNPATLTSLGVVGVGAILLLRWGWAALRGATFSDTRPMQRHALSVLILVSATLTFGLSGYISQVQQFFRTVWGYSPPLAGIALAPILLLNLLLVRWLTRLTRRVSHHHLIGGGLALMSLAMALTALTGPTMPYWPLIVPMALFGLGSMLANTSWGMLFLGALPDDLVGVSSGISKAAGTTGGALAATLLASVLLRFGESDFLARLGELRLSEDQLAVARAELDAAIQAGVTAQTVADSPEVISRLGLLAFYREAYAVGFSTGMLIAAGICLGVGVLAWIWFRPSALQVRAGTSPETPPDF